MPFMYSSATADLGLLETRLSAARAAALDELLAGNLPTDIANNLTAIGLCETEAAAANRDTLTMIDLGVIIADVTGIAGAAMRGTDGVDIAAMRGTDGVPTNPFLATSLVYYSYSGALAAATVYVPAQKTLIFTAFMDGQDAIEEFSIKFDVDQIALTSRVAEATFYEGFFGGLMCDGTNVGLRNSDDAQNTIYLYGVTIA